MNKYEVVMPVWRLNGYNLKKGDVITSDSIGDGMCVIMNYWIKLPITVTQVDINIHCQRLTE
jgi:hypothetical protein